MNKTVHISIDDVSISLQMLTKATSIITLSDIRLFRYMSILHRLFGACFTLYVYNKESDFNLADVPDSFKKEFETMSKWMKFGFHAQNSIKTEQIDSDFSSEIDYFKTNIIRFAGENSLAKINRQHFWYYPKGHIDVLQESGITILLRKPEFNDFEDKHGIINWRTHMNLERDKHFLSKICIARKDNQPFVLFTHEWALNKVNCIKLAFIIAFFTIAGYKFICE